MEEIQSISKPNWRKRIAIGMSVGSALMTTISLIESEYQDHLATADTAAITKIINLYKPPVLLEPPVYFTDENTVGRNLEKLNDSVQKEVNSAHHWRNAGKLAALAAFASFAVAMGEQVVGIIDQDSQPNQPVSGGTYYYWDMPPPEDYESTKDEL